MTVPVPRQRSAAAPAQGAAEPATGAYAMCGAPAEAAVSGRGAAVDAPAGPAPEAASAPPRAEAPQDAPATPHHTPQPAPAVGAPEAETPGGAAPAQAAAGEEHSHDDTSEDAPQVAAATGGALTLLVIGDDPTRALPEMRDWKGRRTRVRNARNLTEAQRLLTDDVHCIVLDLAPLDGEGRAEGEAASPAGRRDEAAAGGSDAPEARFELDALRSVLRLAPHHAVVVLTAEADADRAVEAVRVGAQDYLFRDELDGAVLSRAVRYAVARKRADGAQRQLTETRLRAEENARLERGLLPTPLLDGSDLHFASRYRPGRSRALLGGDFYDTVRTPDGTVHAMIGDVCGHGPDEAALGVELRIAWRALTFAGLCGDELLGTLHRVLENERVGDEIFATLCTVDIAPDGRSAGVCLAGHPSPLLMGAGRRPRLLPYEGSGPALGVLPGARWPRHQVALGGEWSLLMYTDGLIEGRIGEGRERLGQEGLARLVGDHLAAGLHGEDLLDATMAAARDLNGGELTDDVAALLLDRG
ncbi:PP2C family protein-serine/threonine phosphatase [Streptomyces sp. NPDC059740]|uniref:PP2C family protein-serine/threonine phosphatase n=1 Tax=Streptomyces sp. NPDC059740 TaxID=3346926 RepID=UPI00365A450B